MPEAVALHQRIVPGAPPPAPLSKSQKKKRKSKVKPGAENSTDANDIDHPESPSTSLPDVPASAAVEKAPDSVDVQKDALTAEDAHAEAETPTLPDELKSSPVVELISKRLKATTKKMTRITIYASTDPEKLNDDQKRILKTLPVLEAVQKELMEVKKAVEIHEAELVHELIVKKLEIEKAQKAKIADAAAATQRTSVTRMVDVLDLLRVRSLHASGELVALPWDQAEESAILTIADALLGADVEKKEAIIKNFLHGSDDFGGISYTRLSEIIAAGLAPPPPPLAPPPVEEESVEETEQVHVAVESEAGADVGIAGIPETAYPKKGFSFVQESEIDDARPVDDGEWVDAGAPEQALEEELSNGHAEQDAKPEPQHQERVVPVVEEPTTGASIDWATDEADLPPITSIQESFGISDAAPLADAQAAESAPDAANGRPPRPHRRPHHDEEGFTHRGGHGRGRGRGGFRGDRGHRGFRSERGGRGGFRGGEGEFRDREGGFRSGEGEFRARDGEFRGRGGEFRGRGGEFRGREGGHRNGENGGFRSGEGDGPRRGGFRSGEGDSPRGGGFRSGEGDSPRGGGFRSGEGDSPRGGEFRGGEGRGGEENFRGGEGRGGYRGRGEGHRGFRRGGGDWRGNGEHRGRGRGGRGGARGGPQPAVGAPAAVEPAAT